MTKITTFPDRGGWGVLIEWDDGFASRWEMAFPDERDAMQHGREMAAMLRPVHTPEAAEMRRVERDSEPA